MLLGLRILIADKHFSVRTWMREQLSVIGATSISMAGNASEMMRMSRNIAFDVVICDHHLDDTRNGQQLLEELRFQHILPLSSVFMIATAERKYNNVVAAAEFAPDDYLVKPFTPRELALRLDKALRKKKALKSVFDHLSISDHEGVIGACDRAGQVTPQYALDTLRIKAESLVSIGRVEEATAIYESIATTKAVPWARMGYAMMLKRQDRTGEARDEASRLNEEYPDFLSVYDLMAKIHEEAGEFQQAIELLERASNITASSNTDRLRKIADVAEAAGDRPKAISTLKRIVERTRRSTILKVDDYLNLTRSLLEEELLDEAAKVAEEMRVDTKNLDAGELASEVAAAMVSRGKGKMEEAKTRMNKAFDLLEKDNSAVTDTLAVEIAEEAVQHGEVERATSLIAKIAVKTALPNKIKARLSSWFGSDAKAIGDSAAPDADSDLRKNLLGEQIIKSMDESMQALEENWSDEMAAKAREKLIDAFTLIPRDKRVINAHIRYNSIAVKNGGSRHSPTTRASA